MLVYVYINLLKKSRKYFFLMYEYILFLKKKTIIYKNT